MNNHDVIVIGLGVMGSSTCFQLAKRGAKVLGLEQFDIPNARGSSFAHSRMYRQAYFEQPDYVPLLKRAYDLWHELETLSGKRLFHETGVLSLGPPGSELIGGCIRSAERHGLAHQVLDREQLAARFPQFEVPADFIGFHEDAAGALLPEPILSAYTAEAKRMGAELHAHEGVLEWTADATGVTVQTTQATYKARSAIFCGGPWTSKVVGDLGVKLSVTRQVVGWVWPREPGLFELGKIPCWAIDDGSRGLHYGIPTLPDSPGFKVARHAPGCEVDPDTVPRGYLEGDEETIRPVLKKYIPKADGQLLATRVCMYTNTPDGHFILDRHPRSDRVFIACGFSGHGFKFGSVIGEAMADFALTGGTDLPIEFLGLRRFG